MQREEFCEELNALLTKTYQNISELEEKKVRRNSHLGLSTGELHLMERIESSKDSSGATVTELANSLGYTPSAITIALRGLEKKDYVRKIRDKEDKRSVRVRLTEQGAKINTVHQYIHRKLVRDIAKDFTEEEMDIFIRGVIKVNDFFAGLNDGKNQ